MRRILCNVQELKKRCGTKEMLYCFGAGRAFDTFFRIFAAYGLEGNVCAVVDNAEGKVGTCKSVNGREIPVIDVACLLRKITDGDCILITTAAYDSVWNQLEQYAKLRETGCLVSGHLMTAQYDTDRLKILPPDKLSVHDERRIPQTIHYCWFGKKDIPEKYRKWMESWKKYCPDYEIIEWNEDNYDVHKNRYIGQAYDLKQWAFVSDYARVDVIHEYGGVYLDTDVELIKNIDELLKNDAFCGFESDQYVNFGLGFGAVKHHPVTSEIKAYYERQKFILEDGSLNRKTCPKIQTEILEGHGLKRDGTFQVVDGMTVYPSRVLCGMSPHSFRVEKNPVYTYMIHYFAGSWNPGDDWEKQKSHMRDWLEDENYSYPQHL